MRCLLFNWKITKVTTTNKAICTVYGKTSSYVMLKGKGVGRATISVKAKTTRRKYPNNIKIMKCRANVTAAAPAETAFSASAVANSNTEVRVTFSQEIDAPEAANFTVSDGVTVSKAELGEDRKSVVLTIAGAEYGKNYDLTVSGIKVGGKEQAEQKLTFTTPAATDKYPMTLEAKDPILKSDGQSQTVVTFTIKDENGNPITDKGVEVAFTTSLGKFAEQRVSIQNGVATNMFTSEALMQTQTAQITVTVVESTENKELLGLYTVGSITLTPNPESLNASVGAIITSATAPTADRVIAYFNQKVDANDFLTKSKKLDRSKFACEIKSGLDNNDGSGNTTQKHEVVGILPVPGEETALQLLVNKPMMDNTNISVKFTNRLATDTLVTAENTVFTKLTDARQPSVLNVEGNGLRKITVEFSEAMLPTDYCDGWKTDDPDVNNEKFFAADNPDNYLIDGRPISELGVKTDAPGSEGTDETDGSVKRDSWKDDSKRLKGSTDGKIQVGKYDSANDRRHIVEIELGTGNYLAPGTHRLSIANVGDWAAKTDKERNIVNTQGFDFVVESNDVVPTFTVEPQSPEQYKITFNTEFEPVIEGETLTTPNSVEDWASILELQQRDSNGGGWTTISNADGSGKNPIRVSKINNEDLGYIVEVTKDWTDVYKTSSTRMNYYNYDLRLHIDANKIVNKANNKQNAEINMDLTGDIMKTIDVVSPVIGEVVPAEDNSGNLLESYNVTMSEPVKLSNDANKEGLTPSETQAAKAVTNDGRLGVPAPSAQFISMDNGQTVDGVISENAFIDATDTTINIEPSTPLSAGEWRLALSSISDDYGNTASTVVTTINVTRETAATDFRIVWAAVSSERVYNEATTAGANGNVNGRYIFVKFNKPVTLTGNSTNAQVTGNYTINGSTLPTGTQIYAKIQGYDDIKGTATDSITIVLPEGNFANGYQFDVNALNAMLNVSRAITATTGETLSNGGMIRLPFQYGDAAVISSLTTATDAVWGNDKTERHKNAGGELEAAKYYQELKEALESDKYRKVILSHSLNLVDIDGTDDEQKATISAFGRSRTLTIKRAVDLELGSYTIDGNIAVTTSDIVNNMTIKGDAATINGYEKNKEGVATLTVTAGTIGHFEITGATVNKGGDGNAININDTYINTFKNAAVVNGNISITDANGAGFNNSGIVSGDLLINTKGEVNLSGNLKFAAGDILVGDAAVVKFTADAVISDAKIKVNASNARIILDKEATHNANTMIIAEAKDVRVTVPKEQADIKFLTGTNGSFKSVDKDNKEVTTSQDGALVISNDSKTVIADQLSKLNVYTGEVGDVVGDVTVTRGAIAASGSGLNVDALAESIKAMGGTDSDGKEYTLEAVYDLRTSVAVKKENGVIKVTNETVAGEDRIRVTIRAKKGDVTVAEVVKTITITKE